ncbi:MAG: LuxR C-terminal-related transcriptional regulator [Anaerolineae bacterium]|jgi:LuxR family maltose regulon positive regulatory protein
MSTPGIAPQPFTLLRTKFYTPQVRGDWVCRPRLEKRLKQGLDRRLTLVSAPAGFGKSSLVASALSENDRHAAWLSLDESDNDAVRFWTYVIAAIQAVELGVGDEAKQIITSPQLRRTDPAIISLLNEISELTGDLVLVLDDYHVIETEQVHEDLSYLLDHQPANLHMVLISRADPPISLARLRAHGQLMEIRATDLEFSAAEAVILFNDVIDLNLKPEQVEALHERTEGWIVGLQLAALSLRGHSAYDTFFERFTGSHQFVLDYLTEEVLRTLPDAQRQFLLRTSILDRFCAALCQAITGDAASQRLLEEVWKGNLFLIPLGRITPAEPGGRWFRYHHLFAEVLQALLKRDHSDEVAGLHLKAATWFEDQGYADEAVDHALRSGDIQQAKELILKHWLPIFHRGEVATVLRWLDALPEETERDDPSVSLARCWALFLRGQNSAIEPHLEQANHAYERLVGEGALRGAQQDFVAGQLAMMRSVLARGRGEHAGSVAHAEEAARLVPQEMLEGIGTTWNMLAAARAGAGDFDGAIEAYGRGIALSHAEGNLVGAYGCIYGQAMYMLLQGRLNEAEELCRSAIDRAVSEGQEDFPAAGSLYVTMARIHLERYHLDEAEVYLNTGLRIARPGGFGEAVRTGRHVRAHLAAARGDLDAAAELFQDTERIVNAMDDPYLTGELNSEWAKLCLKAGDLDGVRERLHILDEAIAATQHANLLLWRGWLFPRLLCAEERYEEALTALDESIRRARATNSHGELIHLLALQALALDALGDHVPVHSVLHETLALGAPEGYIGRWLDAGPGLEPLLRDLRGDRDTPQASHPYLDSLLDACQTAFGESTPPQPGELLDPLTPRELEILRLIGKGYSNPEIASELVVTINTIKKHTSNIYGKLGVRSRTQAIARAHELNLL